MKKILAMVVALCMLMPLAAFGEAAQGDTFAQGVLDGKALVTEVSFVPGTLPNDLESMQAAYTDLLGALSFRSVTQVKDEASYQNLEMLISGERLFGLDALLTADTFSLISEFFGNKPVAVTKDEVLKLVSDAAAEADNARAQQEAAFAQLALLDEEALGLISEFFGATPGVYTKNNLAEFISAAAAAAESEHAAQLQVIAQLETFINAVFSGGISDVITNMAWTVNTTNVGTVGEFAQADEMLTLLTDLATVMAPYMEKADITEGEVKTEGADDGVMTLTLDLSNEDIREIMPKFGAAFDKSPTLSQVFTAMLAASYEGADASDMTLEKIFTDAFAEMPETMNYKYYYVFDAQGLPVFLNASICDGEEVALSIAYERLTKDNVENHFISVSALTTAYSDAPTEIVSELVTVASLNAAVSNDESKVTIDLVVEGEALVSLVITNNKAEATPATKYEVSLTAYDLSDVANAKDLTVKLLDLGFVIETEKGETEKKFTFTFLMDGAELFGLVVKTSLVDAVDLPDAKDAVHVTTLSEEEMQTFLGAVMQNAMLVLSNALEKLPESVTMVIMSMLQGL